MAVGGGDPRDGDGSRAWFALYTKPYKEYLVRDILRRRGLETYLPEVRVAKPRRGRRSRRPFFPCYLFARFDPLSSEAAHVQWTPGLRRIVSAGGQPVPVPEGVVNHIRRRLERMVVVQEEGPFKRGDRVRILRGPFEGLDAIFDRRLTPEGRVRVFLEWMSRWVAAELDLADLLPPG